MPHAETTTQNHGREIYDYIGIGFGPSNLSIAITAEEEAERAGGCKLKGLFFETGEEFCWHKGMLLEGSKLQVTFLKDLVTLRNPRSKYSFVNYLHEMDRLDEFVNLRDLYPTRIEYNEYYTWVAKQFTHLVEFRKRVVEVAPEIEADGSVKLLKLTVQNLRTGELETYFTGHLLVGTGGEIHIPRGSEVTPDGRVFHSSECRQRSERLCPDIAGPHRFVIVGSGQTAADIFYNLIITYPKADITAAVRGFGFKPQDDTHFVNELFFPETVDLIYNMPEELRREVLNRHRDVTHSAVDIDLLPLLYSALYDDRVLGKNRLHVKRFLDLKGTREEGDRAVAIFEDLVNKEKVEIEADAVILATGYRRTTPLPLLDGVNRYLCLDGQKDYKYERSYSIATNPDFEPRIYLQGYCEPTHGFSEVLLSLLPIRSREIMNDLVAVCTRQREALVGVESEPA